MRTVIAAAALAVSLPSAAALAETLTPANAPDVCRARADRVMELAKARNAGTPKYRLEAELQKSGEITWARDKLDLLYFDPTVSPTDAAQWQYNACREEAAAKK